MPAVGAATSTLPPPSASSEGKVTPGSGDSTAASAASAGEDSGMAVETKGDSVLIRGVVCILLTSVHQLMLLSMSALRDLLSAF